MDDSQTIDQDRIMKINIEEEMKKSYIDYSMSVIVARALPDVRDGFKPVHRRILFGMRGIGNFSNQAYKKCARVVGEVLGKYHPHGDSSVYGALVRMGQSWNMRYTLVDGQGNFGSVDGDSPAAMRYTECRLSKMGEHIMDDIDKDTVDMVNNFDDTLKEPAVMPTKIPNLLVNGGNGIAVGMATNIPTHNLGEVIDGCCAYIDDPEISTDGLMQYIPAPDFPTGAYIYGLQGVKDAYEAGKGRILMRAKAEIESDDSHDKIVVTEIPYGVNKQQLIEYIAELVKEGKIDGIANVNDETGRQGMRIVVDVKRDSNANVILNKLFKMTALQSSFAVNCIALVKGRPCLLTLKDCVKNFVEHRHEVTIRRTQFDLKKAQERAHILEGLIIACDNIDEVVHIIRGSKTPADAQANLEKRATTRLWATPKAIPRAPPRAAPPPIPAMTARAWSLPPSRTTPRSRIPPTRAAQMTPPAMTAVRISPGRIERDAGAPRSCTSPLKPLHRKKSMSSCLFCSQGVPSVGACLPLGMAFRIFFDSLKCPPAGRVLFYNRSLYD